MVNLINNVVGRFWMRLIDYLPDFFGGLLILTIGLFLATLLKKILITFFSFIRLRSLLEKTKVFAKIELRIWQEVILEIVRWTIIILFLIPTLEAWRLKQATVVLNQFLFYLPNVIIAVVISFIGIIAANLTADLVRNSIKTIGATSANSLAIFTKGVIIFFTILIVMNQLGVAQDLIKILFTGIIAMLALAGGLAFGLGGQNEAKSILEQLKKKLK